MADAEIQRRPSDRTKEKASENTQVQAQVPGFDVGDDVSKPAELFPRGASRRNRPPAVESLHQLDSDVGGYASQMSGADARNGELGHERIVDARGDADDRGHGEVVDMGAVGPPDADAREAEQESCFQEQRLPEGRLPAFPGVKDEGRRDHRAGDEETEKNEV